MSERRGGGLLGGARATCKHASVFQNEIRPLARWLRACRGETISQMTDVDKLRKLEAYMA